MKKIITAAIMLLILSGAHAQEKGLYLTVGGSLGNNTFRYTLDHNNSSSPLLGYGGNIGIQYFFTKHLGLGTGIGLSYYHSKGNYANNYKNDPAHYAFDNMTDGDPIGQFNDYQLRLSLDNWTEKQQAFFVEVPLMLMCQTKWGAAQAWGMYAGIGAKLQVPVFGEKYTAQKGSELSVKGYNYEYNIEYPVDGGADLSSYGFGTNDDIEYSGDLDIKPSFALSGKIGLLATISPRVDLMLGVYADYGLNDIKNGNKSAQGYLISPENGSNTIHPSSYVGDNLQYNGYVNSYAVDKVNLLGLGGEIGLRIKLGKLPEEPKKDTIKTEVKSDKLIYNIWVRDSLTLQPILTQAVMECQNCPQADSKDFYSSEFNPVAAELYPQNTYAVTVTKPGFPVYHTTVATTPSEKEINILMPLHPNLTGIARNTSNNPLQDAQIVVTGENGKQYEVMTDPEGRFTILSVDAGMQYTATAVKAGYNPDTVHLYVPSDPKSLKPSYNVENELGAGLRLKPIQNMTLSALVLFDLNKFDLRPEAKSEIDQIIPMLKENPQIRLEVGGHTDSRGSAKYNQTLSQNRANSVREYIISQGIDAGRIKAKGYGYTQLINQCKPGVKCSEEEHQENRRVEFIFTEVPQHITPKQKKTASAASGTQAPASQTSPKAEPTASKPAGTAGTPVPSQHTQAKPEPTVLEIPVQKSASAKKETTKTGAVSTPAAVLTPSQQTQAKAELTTSKQTGVTASVPMPVKQASAKTEANSKAVTQTNASAEAQYRVQISASCKQDADNKLFKKIEKITPYQITEEHNDDGLYHYYIGDSFNKAQAQAIHKKLNNSGIKTYVKKVLP